MDNNEFKLNETGINPVNTASENNDVYFTNVKTQKADINRRENITHTVQNNGSDIAKKRVPVKKGKGVTSTYVFFIVVIALSMLISVYAIFCMNDVFGITKRLQLLLSALINQSIMLMMQLMFFLTTV